MNVHSYKYVSFNDEERNLFRNVITLLENLQEVLGETDYDVIEELMSDIDNISTMEWEVEEEG